MTDIQCPACGSDSVESYVKTIWLSESLGSKKNIELVENKCKICGTTGDFNNKNEIQLKEAFAEMKTEVAISILEQFQKEKRNLSSLERALELPQRTFAKWKNRSVNPSATGVVLLKFLKTFPWLIEVAEQHFDPQMADRILLENALSKFFSELQRVKPEVQTGMIRSEASSFVFLEFSNQERNLHMPSTDRIPQMVLHSQ